MHFITCPCIYLFQPNDQEIGLGSTVNRKQVETKLGLSLRVIRVITCNNKLYQFFGYRSSLSLKTIFLRTFSPLQFIHPFIRFAIRSIIALVLQFPISSPFSCPPPSYFLLPATSLLLPYFHLHAGFHWNSSSSAQIHSVYRFAFLLPMPQRVFSLSTQLTCLFQITTPGPE